MTIGAIALLVTLVTAAGFTLFGLLQAGRQAADLEDYMVSRNRIGGWMAFATVTASALGAWILFSPAEAGSAFGGITAILGYCVGSAAAVGLFAEVGPRLRQLMPQGHALNEYVRYRFGGAMYWFTEAVMVFYMFVYLAAELTAIAKVLQLVANVPLAITALVVITAVFIYTTYGGLSVSILTDGLQFILIVPLLLICFGATVVALGGFGNAFAPVLAAAPELLSLDNIGGLRFGATLVIAIISAEIFNQGNWQRVYACRSDRTVRQSFLASALLILPLLLIAGLLGLLAVQFGLQGDTAFFGLLQQLNPPGWAVIGVIVLALALVMSSLDTLLNGIASVFTIDLMRLMPGQSQRVLRISRLLTVLAGIPAIAIAAQGYSVLYLFFIADLVCAAALFPVLYSLYSRHQTAPNALWSSIFGILAGLIFFPRPDFSPLVPIPGGGDLLHSFAAAVVASTVLSFAWAQISRRVSKSSFRFAQLQSVKRYGQQGTEPMAKP
ncbi:Na+/proline symporter [Romeria aff. gracilis LEGE 07310]|uniref:Na+/proline symporter n=1 Tax=Vasconcelosia minhoensis LEGE 07310 TaxID=915328 RepID=A0A8J7ASP4_9CYAN|nr:Na+/proline symporter [Romeria gracilis]MBE9080056.1 Na+/proline symporter [Romeria aff. gracilis LEGE 07310]